MITLTYLLYAVLTLIALTAMLFAFRNKAEGAMTIAIWTDLLAILMLYQMAHGEILGLFFNYTNSLLYTINLIILILSISYILICNEELKTLKIRKYFVGTISSILVVAGLLLLINVWVNAYFIESRKANLPILQVATMGNNPLCAYPYIFYKKNSNGKASYLCPNYYGLIPRVGELSELPPFLEHQFELGKRKPY